jgi:hypothetical protein
MTAFPWNTSSDEIEYAAPLGEEPSHVHIPRPSRQQGSHDAADLLSPLEDFSVVDTADCIVCGQN